jgi:putative ubiquitin-RnfH superfamily antitoxin RatB of RatAB toxin-antitoxin module
VEQQFEVEVAYAEPTEQAILRVQVETGITVRDAIERSGILERYPQIKLEETKVGIFGKLTTLNAQLQAGDRVEIYRPLIADPKEARKQRAAQGKPMKKGGSSTA